MATKTVKKPTKVQKMPKGIIGLKELRENMDVYIKHIDKGRSFTVVRRSKPVFRVVPVDVWGDEGVWHDFDLTELDPHGVPAGEVLAALRTLNESD